MTTKFFANKNDEVKRLSEPITEEDARLIHEGMIDELLPDTPTEKIFNKWGFVNGKPKIIDWAEDYHRGCCDEF